MTEQEKKNQETPEVKKAEKQAVKKAVDINDYNKYADLKLMVLSGSKLKESAKKDLDELEVKLKSCEGKKGKVNKTIAFGTVTVNILEGIPLPAEYAELIKNPDHKAKYLA